MSAVMDREVKVPEQGTQAYTLLRAFKRGERLTVKTALDQYGVYALSQRVGELKRMGWPIESATVTTGSGAKVSCYWMV